MTDKKKAFINFQIELDNNDNPTKIAWEATDSPFNDIQECRALLLTLWDPEKKQTFGIDLWTNKMMIHEMNLLCYQTILKMADSYEKATKNKELTQLLRDCAHDFANKIKDSNQDVK